MFAKEKKKKTHIDMFAQSGLHNCVHISGAFCQMQTKKV